MVGNPLAQLSKLGQSPWYDQMTRSLVSQGTLKKMIEEDSLRGLTSNPTIFEKAILAAKTTRTHCVRWLAKAPNLQRFTMRWSSGTLRVQPTSSSSRLREHAR